MLSLHGCKYVTPPTSVRSLAQFVGIKGVISVRELIILLGTKDFAPVPSYVLGHNTNSISDVVAALDRGANAIEVDVTAYEFDLNQLVSTTLLRQVILPAVRARLGLTIF